jgi:tetratricopeptide (TPR) repeat protein
MKKSLVVLAALALSGCTLLHRSSNPYEKPPVYTRFLTTGSALDQQIRVTYDAVRANPNSAPLHNDLGQLLLRKGFPKDAEREFERAVDADSHFYQAWYNLGLVRAARDDYSGARRAFAQTVRLMKGHAEALFQLGLMEEKRGDEAGAIAYYAKAIRHNRMILDVRANPLVLDSRLIHLAILKNYERDHVRLSGSYLGTPAGYVPPAEHEAPSPQPAAKDIVTPAPPVTDTATQPPPPKP